MGDPELRPGEDPLAVGADRLGPLLEGGQARVGRPPEPRLQVGSGPGRGPGVPEPPQVLLDEVRVPAGGGQPQETREAGPLVAPEGRRVLQPAEPGALAGRPRRLGPRRPQPPAHGVHASVA